MKRSIVSRSGILIDTGAWLALADEGDRYHSDARRFYLHEPDRHDFVTTNLIVAETWALLATRISRAAALRFWEGLRETRADVVPVEPADLEVAWRIINEWSDQDFSLGDCATFAVMERLGIQDVFAFDSRFLVYRYGRDRQRAFRRVPR